MIHYFILEYFTVLKQTHTLSTSRVLEHLVLLFRIGSTLLLGHLHYLIKKTMAYKDWDSMMF